MAAALSYYAMFSLPPLLLLTLTVVGAFVDPAGVRDLIDQEVASVLGAESARQIQVMISNIDRPSTGGPLVTVLSALGLLIGATGAFGELQRALNRAWSVAPDPKKGGFMAMLAKRVLSLGMILTMAFLLLISLLLSTLISAFGSRIGVWLPGDLSEAILHVLTNGLTLALATVLFGLIFKVMPDADISWRDVAVGAFGTALLFVGGKYLMGEYFARSNPGEVFGAAGSLALVLVWIYYSAMILLFGAEFTQIWAQERGSGILPDEDAVRVVEITKHVPRPDTSVG
jgi:membrane protein